MKVTFFKNRFFIAITPSINIYSVWIIEISWLNYSINIKLK